jgi:cobalt-zinc-cadmium efflux system membrane fusion protein
MNERASRSAPRLAAAGLFALAVLGCPGEKAAVPSAPAAQPPPNEVWVQASQIKEAGIVVEPVAMQDVDDTILTAGRVTFADVEVGHVFSPVTGRVMRIVAQLGQHMKKGEPLAVIQSPDIGQFSSDLGKADADLVAAQRNYKREKDLWEKHSTSQKDFESAEDTYRKAKAEKDRALQKASLLQSGNVNMVDQTYTIPSPIDGELLMRNLSLGVEVQGQYSGGASLELFTVGKLSQVWVLGDVFELDMARVHVGAPATVKVVAYPDKVFEGKVDWVSGILDPTSRTAKVRFTFDNPGGLLKPEMYATVAISVEVRKELALPKGSVLRSKDETVVFVDKGTTPDGQLRFLRVPVEVDEGEGNKWLPVSKGLEPGTRVVTHGGVLLLGLL